MTNTARKENVRTYTEIGKQNGFEREAIDLAIARTQWEPFRTNDLPFMQGEAIKKVIQECRIPISKIVKMALHSSFGDLGFYGLEVEYKNGMAQIYIVDEGYACTIVASDFQENESL